MITINGIELNFDITSPLDIERHHAIVFSGFLGGLLR